MPLLVGALAAGAASLGQAGLSALSTNRQNRKSQEWSEKMYETQKQDNLDFWRMQNDYNSPTEQMSRLKEGGLNPNLVYGQSSGAASGQASPISKIDAKRPEFKTPDFQGIGNSISSYYDTEIKKAQTDNLKKQNTVIEQEAILKAAQVANTGVTTAKGNIELQNLKNYSAEAARLANLKTASTIWAQDSDTDRKQSLHGTAQAQQFENVLQTKVQSSLLRQQIKNAVKDGDLKQLEINLNSAGIQKGDPAYLRIIMQNIDLIKKLYKNDF